MVSPGPLHAIPPLSREPLDGTDWPKLGVDVVSISGGGVMTQTKLAVLLQALMFSFLITSGCSEDRLAPPTGTNESDLVEVTGAVTFIYDNVAADGGVTIDLKLDDDSTERLLFAPFYWGDDSEERWALYSKIQQVVVGDRVRAEGERTDRGIELGDLVILGKLGGRTTN